MMSKSKPPTQTELLRKIPLANLSRTDEVISWLEDHAESRKLKPGDRLPFESEIVEATGISRTCVREALKRLAALGIVEPRRHSGTRLIRPLATHNLMRVLAARDLPEAAFGHVGGMRSALEMGFMPEIFARVTDEDIAALRAICETMKQSATSKTAFFQCEIAFHSQLIEITGNAMAIWMWQMLEPFFQKISPIRVPIPSGIIEKHVRIVDALQRRDEAAFIVEMHAHHNRKLAWDSERYAPGFLDAAYLRE